MDKGAARRTWGRPVIALLGVGWIGLGFSSIGDGRTWHGAAGVALGLLFLASFTWPDSRLDRFLSTPLLRRRKTSDDLSAPGRG